MLTKLVFILQVEAQRAQKIQEANRNGARLPGTGRPPMGGRQDARHMSTNPPQQNNHVGVDDLRRLKAAATARSSVQGFPSFGSGMLGGRSNSGRKTLFGSSSRHGDDSGTPTRAGTPAGQANSFE